MTDVDESSVSTNLLIDELVEEDKNIQTLLKSLIDSENSNTEENLNKLINQINIIVTKINNVINELNKSSHSKMSCDHLKKIKNYLHENRYRTDEEWNAFERYFKKSTTRMMHKFKNNVESKKQPYAVVRRSQKKAINDLIEALKKELNDVVEEPYFDGGDEDDYLASLCDEAEVDGLMSKDPEEKGIITWKPYPPPKKGGKRRRKKSRKRRRKTRRKKSRKRRRKTRRKRKTKRRRRKR